MRASSDGGRAQVDYSCKESLLFFDVIAAVLYDHHSASVGRERIWSYVLACFYLQTS